LTVSIYIICYVTLCKYLLLPKHRNAPESKKYF